MTWVIQRVVPDFKQDKVLWKSRSTPLDRKVSFIIKDYENDDLLLKDFLNVYKSLRNLLIEALVGKVSSNRSDSFFTIHNRSIAYNVRVLRSTVRAMEERKLTKDSLHDLQKVLLLDDRYNDTVINLWRCIEGLGKNKQWYYQYPVSGEIQSWYRYIYKAMGFYNVPRADLVEKVN